MTVTRRAPLFVVLAGAATLLTGCGGGSAGSGQATSPTSGATGSQGAPDAGQARLGGLPGATGLVAAVDGSTLQVQGNNAQTAVTWTAATTFTDQVAARLSDVVVGSCVMVRSSASGQVPESSPVAATSVAITRAVDGRCDARAVRGGQGRSARSASASPSGGTGRPTDQPTGGQGAGRRLGGFGGVFGTVKSVSGASFTVSARTPARAGGATTGSPSTTSRTVQVNTTKATVFTKTVAATAKAAKVGTCVTALGKADDTGAIAATSIAVRPAVHGSCVQGFARRAGGSAAGARTGTTNG